MQSKVKVLAFTKSIKLKIGPLAVQLSIYEMNALVPFFRYFFLNLYEIEMWSFVENHNFLSSTANIILDSLITIGHKLILNKRERPQ